jgi:hypothetical protein
VLSLKNNISMAMSLAMRIHPKNGIWGASAALPTPHFHQETSIVGALHLRPNCRF